VEILHQLSKLKQNFKPDLLHINVPGLSDFFHLRTAKAPQAPLLVTLHGEWDYLSSGNESLADQTFRSADWVAGCSVATLDLGRRLVPEMIVTRSSVMYNPVDVPRLPPSNLIFDTPSLLCLGRLEPEKGFDLAITAFASISTSFPKARLNIAGDGLVWLELEEQVAKQGLSTALEFTGWVAPDIVPHLINNATLFVMPSRRDSFPLVALKEALMGRLVVATRVGGIPEAVVHRDTEILVERENTHAVSEAILHLLNHPAKAIRMWKSARIRAREKFSRTNHVNGNDKLYRKIIAGAARKTARTAKSQQ
jgi:glycogen(starch) synthase